jgi:hypothetical protein
MLKCSDGHDRQRLKRPKALRHNTNFDLSHEAEPGRLHQK